MAGQSITDRIMAGRHTIIGSEMSKIVCKASTHEIMGPKKKHLDYLNALTHEPNINIPELADFLVERSKQSSWVVVFKALITTHHLMCYGNERFLQHLASRNSLFNLANFLDKSGVQGHDMSTFIRRYAIYLNEKAVSYRTVAYDFTRAKRGKESGILRTLPTDKLLKTLPALQQQLDALLAFDANANELSNGVINSCFMLLFKDIIRLFASYNDGIINLLEKYFDMKKPQCKESLDIYKKFLTRMSKVSEFLKVAELVGIDKGDIPDLAQNSNSEAPNSLLDALEQHLNALDGKKGSTKPSEATTAQVNSFTAASSSFSQFDDQQTQATLKDEAERLEAFKREKEKQLQSQTTNNHVAVASSNDVTNTQQQSFAVDFSSKPAAPPAATTTNNLFDLESVFTAPQQTFNTQTQPQTFAQNNAQQSFSQPAFNAFSSPPSNQSTDLFSQQPFTAPQQQQQPNLFPETQSTTPFDSGPAPFQSDLLTPTVFNQTNTPNNMPTSNSSGSLNLETSLADLANLNMASGKANKNFQPKTEKKLTGGINYQPNVAAGTTMPVMNSGNPMMAPSNPMMAPSNPMMMGGMQMNTMMTPTAGQMGMHQNMYNPMMQQTAYNQNMMVHQQPMRQLNPNNPFGAM